MLKWPVRTESHGAAPRALEEFEASLQHLSPSAKRRYLAGAKALLRAAFPGPPGIASYAELWARTRGVKPPKPARARPFLRFLESRQPRRLRALRPSAFGFLRL